MRYWLLSLLLLTCGTSWAQPDTTSLPHSSLGWSLSPHGTIRILLLYVEIDWDVTPEKDPQANGAEHWEKGRLPKWKDEVFDPHPLRPYKGQVTQYYHDMSLGRYTVLGDYIDKLLVLKQSEYPTVGQAHSVGSLAVKEANKMGSLQTRHGLSTADFDLWQRGGRAGMPKQLGADQPHSYDHVMVIVRNNGLTHNQGSVDNGSAGKLFGFESDSQSRFGGMNALPFEILQHEFNHLLLGGNNFHSGGGNASQFQSYFIALQGGWSMMGGSSSSLLTCSGWDRYRLGWTPQDSPFAIRATTMDGLAMNGDLDPLNGDTGLYVLRDFVTTGDAIRIRMPYLNKDEYPQFLWLENHQGWKRNGVRSDRFHYELEMTCVNGVVPGIYAAMQVDRENRSGKDLYGGHADYLRALPASGFYDMEPRGDTVINQCLWGSRMRPLVVKERWNNPLAGASELEIPLFDPGTSDRLFRAKDGVIPRIEERDGRYVDEAMFFGHSRQAFTPSGNSILNKSSNPPLANMTTMTSTSGRSLYKGNKPDNRIIHLSDFRITVREQRADGSIVVHVGRNDLLVDRDVRWCGDSIVLHPPLDTGRYAMLIAKHRHVRIDRSRTPSRIEAPDTVGRARFFNDPTTLVLLDGVRMRLEESAVLSLENGSTMHVMPGAALELHPKARLVIDRTSCIVLHGDARVLATPKQMKRLRKAGRSKRIP